MNQTTVLLAETQLGDAFSWTPPAGTVFLDPATTTLRVSDGSTPGGVTVGGGSAPGYLALPSRNDTQFTIGGGGTLDGIQMTTDRGTVKFGNTPECVPTGASHFHIMKQDPTQVDLFFGDDLNYVKLPTTGGVTVQSQGTDFYTWQFGTDGNLTFPVPSSTTMISSVGYLGLPQHNLYDGTYTLDFSDMGQHIYVTYDSPQTIIIPANTDLAFPVGATIAIITNGSSTAIITITTDTLTQLGTGSTDSRTLGANSMATLIKVAATQWVLSGVGLS